jgi:hypothetical protein
MNQAVIHATRPPMPAPKKHEAAKERNNPQRQTQYRKKMPSSTPSGNKIQLAKQVPTTANVTPSVQVAALNTPPKETISAQRKAPKKVMRIPKIICLFHAFIPKVIAPLFLYKIKRSETPCQNHWHLKLSQSLQPDSLRCICPSWEITLFLLPFICGQVLFW